MNTHADEKVLSSGIDTLVAKLREAGVEKGRIEAAKLVAEAESRADWILKQAEEEADQLRTSAKRDARQMASAGREALKIAARDTVLSLKEQLVNRFTGEVGRLVGAELQREELLQQIILVIAGRLREHAEEAQKLEVLLPQDKLSQESSTGSKEELEKGPLTHFIRLINRDILREGVSFGVADDDKGGLRFRIKEDNVVLDMSDKALTQELLQYMLPRFRALLEGMVK
ncbi:MAG: hypothetical protein HQL54_03455 [Magnetococcales bacterium]|nr:hypothetical protein [Magnetococcales bacterium]